MHIRRYCFTIGFIKNANDEYLLPSKRPKANPKPLMFDLCIIPIATT